MKRIKTQALHVLFILLTFSVNELRAETLSSTRIEHEKQMTQESNKNKALLAEFMEEIWNKGNLDTTDKYVAPTYTIAHNPGDPWEGQSLDIPTFNKRVLSSRKVFPDLHFTTKDMVAEGDKVAISWEFQGTHKGDIPGVPGTGQRVHFSGITIYSFSNGKITGHWQVVDRLGLMESLKPKK